MHPREYLPGRFRNLLSFCENWGVNEYVAFLAKFRMLWERKSPKITRSHLRRSRVFSFVVCSEGFPKPASIRRVFDLCALPHLWRKLRHSDWAFMERCSKFSSSRFRSSHMNNFTFYRRMPDTTWALEKVIVLVKTLHFARHIARSHAFWTRNIKALWRQRMELIVKS